VSFSVAFCVDQLRYFGTFGEGFRQLLLLDTSWMRLEPGMCMQTVVRCKFLAPHCLEIPLYLDHLLMALLFETHNSAHVGLFAMDMIAAV
jgi:hypothetical protein